MPQPWHSLGRGLCVRSCGICPSSLGARRSHLGRARPEVKVLRGIEGSIAGGPDEGQRTPIAAASTTLAVESATTHVTALAFAYYLPCRYGSTTLPTDHGSGSRASHVRAGRIHAARKAGSAARIPCRRATAAVKHSDETLQDRLCEQVARGAGLTVGEAHELLQRQRL